MPIRLICLLSSVLKKLEGLQNPNNASQVHHHWQNGPKIWILANEESRRPLWWNDGKILLRTTKIRTMFWSDNLFEIDLKFRVVCNNYSMYTILCEYSIMIYGLILSKIRPQGGFKFLLILSQQSDWFFTYFKVSSCVRLFSGIFW